MKTNRGFEYKERQDRYGQSYSIQKSSLAFEDCIWFGLNGANPKITASQAHKFGVIAKETTGWVDYPIPEEVFISTRMHLTREQVAEIIPILQHFVDTGELPDE